MRLTLRDYLLALDEHGIDAAGVLHAQGYHPKVIIAKAEKASKKGYSNFGVSPWHSWIEDRGRAFLACSPVLACE